jgi:RHS repeat-associated protein
MRVPDNAGFDPGMEIAVTPKQVAFVNPIRPQQKGYIYIWVSKESENTKVWFDDLKVTHRSRRVTQATDYYAYGSVLREQKTPEELTYRYKYQGQYAEKDEETGWSHFELREYDPVVGRWTSKDPYGQYYSPYIGIGNDPINGTDPDGGWFDDFYIYSNGSVEVVNTGPIDNFYYVSAGGNVTTLAEGWTRNANGLLQMPENFSFNSNGISFGFTIKNGNHDRAFVDPKAMAAMFGAFVEVGASDFVITQFSYSNGASPSPSTSHINGKNGDFRYLRKDQSGAQVTVFETAFDIQRNSQFTTALNRFGYKDLKSYYVPAPFVNIGILPSTSHLEGHHNHLHLQGFSSTAKTTTLWNLVADECDYKHSSANFYATGEQGVYVVTNYTELEDVDLTK